MSNTDYMKYVECPPCKKCGGRGMYVNALTDDVLFGCEVCHGTGIEIPVVKKTFRDYIKLAKDKAIESWHLTILAGFALFEATWAIVEFILHVLRIPHWH